MKLRRPERDPDLVEFLRALVAAFGVVGLALAMFYL